MSSTYMDETGEHTIVLGGKEIIIRVTPDGFSIEFYHGEDTGPDAILDMTTEKWHAFARETNVRA